MDPLPSRLHARLRCGGNTGYCGATALLRRPSLLFFVILVTVAACSGSPTQSSTVTPPAPPPAVKIVCPNPVSLVSSTGEAQAVHFDQPTTSGGTAPIQISCTPASDTVFPIGSKTVTCTATDSKSQTDQCTFGVTLTAPPKISQTSFVAFGDSMTWGEVPSEGVQGRIRILKQDLTVAYPTVLQSLLRSRYLAQAGAIQVTNAGKQGEHSDEGLSRLPSVIDGGLYRVVLLMEGVNDFPDYQFALANMRNMIEYAKRRTEIIFVATVPPENAIPQNLCYARLGNNQDSVAPYNAGLRSLAAAEGVTLVDVNADFNGDNTTLIDCDGLHPTAAGYKVIATSFFNAIKTALEVPATTTSTPFTLPVPRIRRSR